MCSGLLKIKYLYYCALCVIVDSGLDLTLVSITHCSCGEMGSVPVWTQLLVIIMCVEGHINAVNVFLPSV